MSGTTRRFPSVAMQQSLNPSLFILHRNRYICRAEIPKSFAPLPTVPRASDEHLSDSPLTPTRSSDLLPFWGEDLNRGGDRIAEQFWGDIFAELLQGSAEELTRVRNASRLLLLLLSLLLALLLVTASCHCFSHCFLLPLG